MGHATFVFLSLCAVGAGVAPKKPHGRKAPQSSGISADPNRALPNKRVAVLPLGALGLPEDMRRNLESLLTNSIRTMKGVQLIPTLDLQIMLQNPKNADLAACGGGPVCAVRIAKAAGADLVVFGTLSQLGDQFNFSLRAVDVATTSEVGRQNVGVSGSRDKLIPEVRLAAYRLIAPDQLSGALMVDADVDGMVISIDDTQVGTTPLKSPIELLSPGEHTVQLQRMGYEPIQKKLTIRAFETTRLRLDMKKSAP